MKCYNCDVQLNKSNRTKEHIPSQNLFVGYSNDTKKNRITVPACKKCNSIFAKIDEEFRNFIGVINKHPDNKGIVEKAERGFYMIRKNIPRVVSLDENRTGVKFDTNLIDDYHIKNFKGIFYKQYNKPIIGYTILPTWDESDKSRRTLKLISYLIQNFEWKVSGNEKIFRYIIQPFRENLKHSSKEDLKLNEGEQYIMSIMEYNKQHAVLVLAERD